MKNPSKVLVNNTQEFTIGNESILKLDVLKESASTYHLLHKQKSYLASLISADFNDKTYSIRINSTIYQVKIKSHLDDLVKNMGYSNGSAKILNTVIAPMPGIIIGLNVKKDQEVKKGDTLLILEAMKMENAITCPKDAKIKDISVAIGDTVDKNKLLITLQ